MSMSVGTLIEFSTAALESVLEGMTSKLEQVRDRLDGLQDRIADLEKDGSSGLSEDEVRDIAQEAVDGAAILDEDDVERIVGNQGYLTSSDAYDAVSEQVYDMVKDVVREDLDEKDFADSDHDHDGIYATTDSVDEVESRVSTLESTVDAFADHEDRIEALEARDGHSHANDHDVVQALVARIESLEADRAEHLRLIQDLQESSSGATRFFKLAVQMLDIVRESVGR